MESEYNKWYSGEDLNHEPDKGANVLYETFYDYFRYGVGYYDGECIICDDGFNEEESTHIRLNEIDQWMMFHEPEQI